MEDHLNFYRGKLSNKLLDFNIDSSNNEQLAKLFELYSCLILSELHDKKYLHYEDISGDFKEENGLTQNDSGIDFCDLQDTIGQCKLYSKTSTITYKSLATFLAGQIINRGIVRWPIPMLVRLIESKVSNTLRDYIRKKRFDDIALDKKVFMDYLHTLQQNPVEFQEEKSVYSIRPYQQDVLDIFNDSKDSNITIKLPTGTGKSYIVIKYSIQQKRKKFLILVPKIVLMLQWFEEYQKHSTYTENDIYLLSNEQRKDYKGQRIVICIYDSIQKILNLNLDFYKIVIDEAHHIRTPQMYKDEDFEEQEDLKEQIDYSKATVTSLKKICKEKGIRGYSKPKITKSDIILLLDSYNSYTYLQFIRNLYKGNNIIEISATIDQLNTHKFYELSIRDAIDQGFLCDYTITVPIFTEDIHYNRICRYLTDNLVYNTIIYCKNVKDAESVCIMLNKFLKDSADYITYETSKSKRKTVINKFKRGKLKFLVNVRVLTEGFDAPNTINVVVLSSTRNDIAIIQILGRCLRLNPSKKIANIIFPVSDKKYSRDISFFLKTLCDNDIKLSKSWSKKILGGYVNIIDIEYQEKIKKMEETENDDESDLEEDIELLQNELYTEIYDSFGKNINPTYKSNVLLEFVEEFRRVPKYGEIYKGFKIGGFWDNIKQGQNTQLYLSILSKNPILREDYDRVQNHKEEKKTKKQWTPTEKSDLLLEFVVEFGTVPKFGEIYKGVVIGRFWNSIKQGQNTQLYLSILSKNPILRADYERLQNLKEEKKTKKQWTPTEKSDSLLEFVVEFGTVPKFGEIYKGFKIGGFWNNIKQGQNTQLYLSILSKNPILRADYERVQNLKEEKKTKKQLNAEEKAYLLLKFVEEFGRLPKQGEIYEGVKIGHFWDSIKQGHNTQLYLTILSKNPILRDDYERLQNLKEEKKKGS